MKIAALLLLLVTAAQFTKAQAKPEHPTKPPAFSEDAQKNILIAYQKALLGQNESQQSVQNAQGLAQKYQAVCAKEAKAAGFPEGTQCQANVANDTVTPIMPPPPKKEEPAKQ